MDDKGVSAAYNVVVRIRDETWLTEFHVDEVAVLGVNLTKEDI
jgi:hypothetical protein